MITLRLVVQTSFEVSFLNCSLSTDDLPTISTATDTSTSNTTVALSSLGCKKCL